MTKWKTTKWTKKTSTKTTATIVDEGDEVVDDGDYHDDDNDGDKDGEEDNDDTVHKNEDDDAILLNRPKLTCSRAETIPNQGSRALAVQRCSIVLFELNS